MRPLNRAPNERPSVTRVAIVVPSATRTTATGPLAPRLAYLALASYDKVLMTVGAVKMIEERLQ